MKIIELKDSVRFDPPLTGVFKMHGYQRPMASISMQGRGGENLNSRVTINPATFEGPEHNMMMDLPLSQAKKFAAELTQFLERFEKSLKPAVDDKSVAG